MKYLIFTLLIVCNALGEDLYAKIYGGVNFLRDSEFEGSDFLGRVDNSFDSGQIYGASLGYELSNSWGLELDYAWRSNEIKSNSIVKEGDYASVAILVNGIYTFDLQSFKPYLGVGAGFLQEIDADIDLKDGRSFEDFEDSSFAWQALAGVRYELSEAWNVFGEARYLDGPSVKMSKSDNSIKADYQNTSLLFGVSYNF